MINYTMMDETTLINRCLHYGPISSREIMQSNWAAAPAEEEFDVQAGTIANGLRTVCRTYGSCAVLAWDDDAVVGKLRFYPAAILPSGERACVSTEDGAWFLARLSLGLPPKEELPDRALQIMCYQVFNRHYCHRVRKEWENAPDYLGKGIGVGMLKHLISWATAEGWEELRACAVPHIRPLMLWSECLSVERYKALGFSVTPSQEKSDVAASQRRGLHGAVIQRMWDDYPDVTDEDASMLYNVSLQLVPAAVQPT